MTRRRKSQEPQIVDKVFTSLRELESAMTKVDRLTGDLRALDPLTTRYDDQVVRNLEFQIRNTIGEIFGRDSPEFQQYRYWEIWDGRKIITRTPNRAYRQTCFANGIAKTRTMVEGLRGSLADKKRDFRPPPQDQADPLSQSHVLVLFLSANPEGTPTLSLDREAREIETKIRASEHRDALRFVSKWAVRPDDLLQALNEERPHIVHFSGHGSESEEILLVGEDQKPKRVSKEALQNLFRALKDEIRGVVLNACFSRSQAEAIVEEVDFAIGMNRAVSDDAAILFAASFYRAVGFGRSIKEAFEQGRTALLLEGIEEEQTPQLVSRKGVDPATIYLIRN